jgi:hypothetical protein
VWGCKTRAFDPGFDDILQDFDLNFYWEILSEYTVSEKLFGIMQFKGNDIRYCSRKVEYLIIF